MKESRYPFTRQPANSIERAEDNHYKIITHSSMEDMDDDVLRWWSTGLTKEAHTTSYTPEELKASPLVRAVVIMLDNKTAIGAARLIPARTIDSQPLMHAGKQVLELRSNYVEPNFRNQGIGKMLIEERLKYLKEDRGCIIVIKTSNPIIEKVIAELGAKIADSTYQDVKESLCICPEGRHYSYCSFSETGNLWFFENAD